MLAIYALLQNATRRLRVFIYGEDKTPTRSLAHTNMNTLSTVVNNKNSSCIQGLNRAALVHVGSWRDNILVVDFTKPKTFAKIEEFATPLTPPD